jgi:hypothetical protein
MDDLMHLAPTSTRDWYGLCSSRNMTDQKERFEP